MVGKFKLQILIMVICIDTDTILCSNYNQLDDFAEKRHVQMCKLVVCPSSNLRKDQVLTLSGHEDWAGTSQVVLGNS